MLTVSLKLTKKYERRVKHDVTERENVNYFNQTVGSKPMQIAHAKR